MGDRTAVTLYAKGLDSLSVKRKAKLVDLLGEKYDLFEPSQGYDTLPTDRWSSNTWQWFECYVGSVYDAGVEAFATVVSKLEKWGLDTTGAKIWEDPKYEHLGTMVLHLSGHRFVHTNCDSDGDGLLGKSEIPESAMVSHEALGEFVASHFGLTVQAEKPLGQLQHEGHDLGRFES